MARRKPEPDPPPTEEELVPPLRTLEERNAWLGLYASMLCGALAGNKGKLIDQKAIAHEADEAYEEYVARLDDDKPQPKRPH